MISLSQPTGDFWYLALLAVSPKRRGLGLGMKLLRSCLDAPSLKVLPAYLEATTPANARRYRDIGFCEMGDLELPEGPVVTRMWREPN
jgi:predicted N-acetyltransferase YhbS